MKRLLSSLISLFSGILKHPWITIAVGVVLLICLIWVAGPFVGIVRSETRFILIIGVLLVWVLFLVIEHYRADKGARLLEQSLRKQAQEQVVNARPDRKEEIEALRAQFDKAVSSLKQSKLGKGSRGGAALYALPWYMFIGPPASGKSTALLHSGLQFPYLDASGKGIQGVGGTRNCDWWFTNEAILLDTAGRYVTEDEDREEWLGFLDLLKQYRKKKPINGVLVSMSVPDLLQANEEELEWHAKNIRGRIDELIERLGIIFPVYLVFTKCDLIRGFVEFFEDLNKSEREQLWGVTLPKAAASATPAHLLFDSEFQLLGKALYSRRLGRLASVWGSQKIRDIYSFPLQFVSGRERLKRFVELLFQPSPYHENPICRGFYFTSGTQEGAPIDRIMGAISRASGLTDMMSEALDSGKETKSYFIKNLFTDVVFPDAFLAGSSSAMEKQRDYMRVGIFAGAVLASVLAVVGLSFSFIGNRHIISSVKSVSMEVSGMKIDDEAQFAKTMELLDKLRGRVEQLQGYEENGIPLRLRGGLYRGYSLYSPLRRLYFENFAGMLLASTKNSIEIELEGFISNPDRLLAERDSDYYYSLLKAYLMITEPARIDSGFLDPWLQKIWGESIHANYGENQESKALNSAVSRQIYFYAHQSDYKGIPRIPEDQRLIEDTRRILRRTPFVERIYSRIRRGAEGNSSPYTLGTALHGQEQDVLVNDYKIPALFTYEGYTNAFQETMKKVIEESGQEGWVLGVPDTVQAELGSRIEGLYFEEYVLHWHKFIEATRISPADSLPQMAKRMEVLAQKDSPLNALMKEVVRNTDLDGEMKSQSQGMASGLLQKVKKGMQLVHSQGNSTIAGNKNPVSARFRSVHEFVSPSEEGKGDTTPLALYLKELGDAYAAIQDAVESGGGQESYGLGQSSQGMGAGAILQASRNTERILQGLDHESRKSVGSLLLQPFQMAAAGVMNRVQTDMNGRWRSAVYEHCLESISGRYPFRKDGEDASLTDVADFFHPNSGILWQFYDKEIKPFVEEGRDRWTARKGTGGGMSMSPEFLENMRVARLISESLFPRGNADPQVTFELYPYPSPGASEILLRVDGKELRYRNEPQEWHEMAWTGASGNTGALIQVNPGGTAQSRTYPGRWGLFKLLGAARTKQISPTHYQVEWDFTAQGSRIFKVRYDLRGYSYKNPFKPGFFSGFKCMSKMN